MNIRLDAAKLGQKFYNGRPCKNCGGIIRHTISASCVVCNRKRSAETAKRVRDAVRDALKLATEKGGNE